MSDESSPSDFRWDKYRVTRTDGQGGYGAKHADCRYFALDLTPDHDPFAMAALRAYADACQETCPELAIDLRRIANTPESDAPLTHCIICNKQFPHPAPGTGNRWCCSSSYRGEWMVRQAAQLRKAK